MAVTCGSERVRDLILLLLLLLLLLCCFCECWCCWSCYCCHFNVVGFSIVIVIVDVVAGFVIVVNVGFVIIFVVVVAGFVIIITIVLLLLLLLSFLVLFFCYYWCFLLLFTNEFTFVYIFCVARFTSTWLVCSWEKDGGVHVSFRCRRDCWEEVRVKSEDPETDIDTEMTHGWLLWK